MIHDKVSNRLDEALRTIEFETRTVTLSVHVCWKVSIVADFFPELRITQCVMTAVIIQWIVSMRMLVNDSLKRILSKAI